ncbi:hypothetical protein BN77_p40057 [Rhizobium mesoamericanum STM3625]|uniref:Uncharacterized protein n=1 Tax=Rhizobium mesoamericanum STM3625 TaxID=1211777 RepID=K0Q437_9HYPH|nr:hypothetical protein BN77_p40057 [Rhizobium mesoamericanum STM3625]
MGVVSTHYKVSFERVPRVAVEVAASVQSKGHDLSELRRAAGLLSQQHVTSNFWLGLAWHDLPLNFHPAAIKGRPPSRQPPAPSAPQ